jgi:hypothetical protein
MVSRSVEVISTPSPRRQSTRSALGQVVDIDRGLAVHPDRHAVVRRREASDLLPTE